MTPPTAQPSWDGVLVRFGEIGIKSAPVRARMLARLGENLLNQMVRRSIEGDVETRGSRVFMLGPDPGALLDAAVHTFGVVSASPVRRVAPTMAAILAAAPEIALRRNWSSFAIRARREGNQEFSSQEVGIQAGSAVYKAAEAAGRTPKVDLKKPDLELHIDVRQDACYIFLDETEGPGGIPVSTQGKVVALLRNRNDALAAWFLLRRGCAVAPAGTIDEALVSHLAGWGLSRPRWGQPEEAATSWDALALCSGETLGEPLAAIGSGTLPILRPLHGLDPEERKRWMRRSGLES
ncbi:MAG: THUMP domain-containing protein [Candidatus Thermoplasmatota archaeon]